MSRDRFATYNSAANHDRSKAIDLYLWNSRICQDFYLTLQNAEVTLRNAISNILIEIYGLNWFNQTEFLQIVGEHSKSAIRKIKDRISAKGYDVTCGRVVAGLTFDFWSSLLSQKFDRALWQTNLRRAFPNLPGGLSRAELYDIAVESKEFRNRVAHYEPIIKNNISMIHTNIIRIIRFRCIDTANWTQNHSVVQKIIREKP